MWMARIPISVADGKPMLLPAPKLPNLSASRVPGTISPVRLAQRHPASTARFVHRLTILVTDGG